MEFLVENGADGQYDGYQLLNHRTIPTDFRLSSHKVHPAYLAPQILNTDAYTAQEWAALESLYFPNDKWFFAMLGMNLQPGSFATDNIIANSGFTGFQEVVNMDAAGQSYGYPGETTGFSISTSIETYQGGFEINSSSGEFYCGSCVVGNYYDMPSEPDLKIKMEIEMDGVRNIKTPGGASLTGINYSKPQDWGPMGAWQLDGQPNFRSGRRVWNLSFSYLSDSDIMPTTMTDSLRIFDSSQYTLTDDYYYSEGASGNLWNEENRVNVHNDFFSQVWNKTLGSHLPFIFNPSGGGNSPNNSPDQFAICRFDMDSLQITQQSFRKYKVKLKIRECW